MSIDWFTVAAQIVNFLVLVWLMKRFLYRPILDGIDAREAEIAHRLKAAAAAKASAAVAQSGYDDKVRALNAEQSELSETIRKSAEEERGVLLAKTQQQIETQYAAMRAQHNDEARKFTAELHQAGAAAVLDLARKAVHDLSGETLESRMTQHLAAQLKPMVDKLKSAAGKPDLATVITHGALSPDAKSQATLALTELFKGVEVGFDVDPKQSAGLMIRMGGAELAWTVDSYFDGLNAQMRARLSAGADEKGGTYVP